MKVGKECFNCISRLIEVTSELSAWNVDIIRSARREAINILESEYDDNVVPANLSTKILRALKAITGNPDPFIEVKRKEIDFARKVSSQINPPQNLRSLVEFSALGNTLDFFKEPESLLEIAYRFPGFAHDDLDEFAERLPSAKKILYLADNAGECFFDKPLVAYLAKEKEVTYVVKDSSAQNDITYDDLEYAGLVNRMGRVISTGDDAIGIDLATASEEIAWWLKSSDLIVAKGMGNYETLSELPIRNKILYVLMAKCGPVASSLNSPINSYLAIMR